MCLYSSDGSVVSFQKTTAAVLDSLAVFLKTTVAVVPKFTTAVAVAVITYIFNLTKNWKKEKYMH